MGDANGAADFLHILPSGAAAAESVNLDVFRSNLYVDVFFGFRHDFH